MRHTKEVTNKMKRTTKVHGKEVTCSKCETTQNTTVTIHELSGVAAFSCIKCGKTQEP